MAIKAKRKRIVKPTIPIKPIIPDNPHKLELISVPIAPNEVLSSCLGCFFYEEVEEKCNEKMGRDCTGVIFVEKNQA